MLSVYQKAFLQMALDVHALQFGEFTLKSGRKSPYFFNAGRFCDGKALLILASAYADTILKLQRDGVKIDVLYGPAYKGIPLVASIATILFFQHQINLPWAFDRKEAKDHGEGGRLVGAPLKGKKVLIVDDVLTAGTAIRQSLNLLRAEGADVQAVVVALDRQEIAPESQLSTLNLLAQEEKLTTAAVVTLDNLLQFIESVIESDPDLQPHFAAMNNYRAQYGVKI